MNILEKYTWIFNASHEKWYVYYAFNTLCVLVFNFSFYYMYVFWGVVAVEYMYLWELETLNT